MNARRTPFQVLKMVEFILIPPLHSKQTARSTPASELLSRLGEVRTAGISATPRQFELPETGSFLEALKREAVQSNIKLVPLKDDDIQELKNDARKSFLEEFKGKVSPGYPEELDALLAFSRAQRQVMLDTIAREKISHVFIDPSATSLVPKRTSSRRQAPKRRI